MNSRHNKRILVAGGIVLAVALSGLLFIDTGPAIADGSLLESGSSVAAENGLIANESSALPSILKMVSALVVVVFCIYGSLFLLKRLMGRRVTGNGPASALEVLETTWVAPKKSVSLIRVADRSVLVGITEQQISHLTELDAEQTAALLAQQKEAHVDPDFDSFLKSASKKIKNWGTARRPATAEL